MNDNDDNNNTINSNVCVHKSKKFPNNFNIIRICNPFLESTQIKLILNNKKQL